MNVNEIGRPLYFDMNKHIEAIVQMIRADELQIALQMIDQVPAWYRENRDGRLENIRRTLYKNLYDQIEYASDDEEAECTREFGEKQWDSGYMFPRANIILDLIQKLNYGGQGGAHPIKPWIFDLGCSHGNLPLGLMKCRLSFSYKGVGLNGRIVSKVKEWVGDYWADEPSLYSDPFDRQSSILYCTEVIEHCMNPMDIVQSAYKVGVQWDYILLSVPLGCLGGGLENWDSRRLGHVRGWTKQEFVEFADKNWPGYKWQLTVAPSMVLLGSKA
jgi:hypothetical protein